ncbi:MAG: PKD domain-containing protein [Bacteroidota bacterium]|nr:PKD domain-containing protein [Bacteroidota bacterium]
MIFKNKIFITLFAAFIFSIGSSVAQNCTANFEFDTTNYIVTFKNKSTAAGIYKSYWNLGDGNYSLSPNPIHAYTNPGEYYVFLKVEDAANKCKDIFMDTIIIVAASPGCKANYKIGVLGDSLICNSIATGTDSSTTYTWFFENTVFSTDENPIWKYTKTGIRAVKLLIQSQNCTDSIENDIYIKPKYICDATFETVTSADTTTFITKTYNPNAVYFWDFGDNTTTTGNRPFHVYEYNGTYKVTLTMEDTVSGCAQTWSSNIGISGLPAFKVSYSYNINKKTVSFEAAAKFNLKKEFIFSWKFGDGGTETGNLVEHTYNNYGNYDVELTIVDTPVSAVVTKKFTILVVKDTSSYSLGGKIKLDNGTPIDEAFVLLIENDSNTNNLPHVVDTTYITVADSGLYFFNQKKPGRYTVKVLISPSSLYYSKYIPIYFGNRISWKNAQYFQLTQDILQSIELNQKTISTNGSNSITVVLTIDKLIKEKYFLKNQSATLYDVLGKPLQTGLTNAQGKIKFDNLHTSIYYVRFDVVGKISNGKNVSFIKQAPPTDTIYFNLDGFTVSPYENLNTSIIQTSTLAYSEISLFPVPANDQLTVHTNVNLLDQTQIQIMMIDATGRQVKRQETINKEFHTIDISSLPQGIYWCVLTGKNGFIKNIPVVKK